MQNTITESTTDGLRVVRVDTGVLSLAVMPQLGGKISSLRDGRSQREWLWRNGRIAYRRVPPSASYVTAADTGGWDECFPTVAPCAYPSPPWAGTALPDHGELWAQEPELFIEEDADEVTLRTHWHGVALPYTFERTLHLPTNSARVRFDYAVTSDADAPIQFIWSAHPLLAVEPGMRLLLPPEARFHAWASMPPDLLPQAHDLQFPLTVQTSGRDIDLATLPDASVAIALKLWSEPLMEGWAALHAPNGELRMRWDAALLPQVGFWLNGGAWAGDGGTPYYNLGLEPCIGAQDSLADAVTQQKLWETLPPRGTRTWWLEVEVAA